MQSGQARQQSVSGVILAGGLGIRIGGDKANRCLLDKPLTEWVAAALAGQCDELLINVGPGEASPLPEYATVTDCIAGYAGPLAGVHAAMRTARFPWLVSAPCDTPFLPPDLVVRLMAQAEPEVEAVVATVGGKRQPTVVLYRTHLHARLESFLQAGGRRAGEWLNGLSLAEAEFADAAGFVNINTALELQRADEILRNGGDAQDVCRAFI